MLPPPCGAGSLSISRLFTSVLASVDLDDKRGLPADEVFYYPLPIPPRKGAGASEVVP